MSREVRAFPLLFSFRVVPVWTVYIMGKRYF